MDPLNTAQGPWGGLPPLADLFDIGSLPMLLGTLGDLLWAVAYIFFAIIGFRQRTYALPLLAVCLNFSWEFAFVVVARPEQFVALLPHLAWLLIDAVLVWQVIRYGKGEQSHPQLQRLFYPFLAAVFLLAYTGELTLHRTMLHNSIFPDTQGHTVAFIINLVMSILFITFLMGRPHLRGISIAGAWAKMLGTALISIGNILVFLRAQGSEFEMQMRRVPTEPGAAVPPWREMGEFGVRSINTSFYMYLFATIFLMDVLYIYLVYRQRAQVRAAAMQ